MGTPIRQERTFWSSKGRPQRHVQTLRGGGEALYGSDIAIQAIALTRFSGLRSQARCATVLQRPVKKFSGTTSPDGVEWKLHHRFTAPHSLDALDSAEGQIIEVWTAAEAPVRTRGSRTKETAQCARPEQ